MTYQVFFKRSARKELERLEKVPRARVLEAITSLANEPRPPGSKKLRASRDLWRIRVGSYRVIYSITDLVLEIEVIVVRHRSEAYR